MQRIDERSLVAADKPDLVIHDTPELNAETPAHLLDDDITPTRLLFARNTGAMPVLSEADIAGWTLRLDGLVRHPRTWTVAALQREFETIAETAVMECAGNGRAFFAEPVRLVQWRHGAVGCVQWSGVRLGDLLRRCELLPQATTLGTTARTSISTARGRRSRAGCRSTRRWRRRRWWRLRINGEPLSHLHGAPLRLVVPGYPGASFQKWLTRIEVRDREHDGERMRDGHYRMPRQPVRPGEPYDNSDFEIITDIPVKSLITVAAGGISSRRGRVAGHQRPRLERTCTGRTGRAVARRRRVLADRRARSPARPVRLAAVHLHADRAARGAIEIIARATDADGRRQPLDSVPWNPRGYLNNVAHRVRGRIG